MAGGNDLSDNRYLFVVFEIFKVLVFAASPLHCVYFKKFW